MPWIAAITDPNDSSIVYVFADNDRVDASVCDITVDRAVVVDQDSRQVSVEVAGYTPTSHRTEACADVGHAPVSVAVHLGRPLAGRQLVDAHDGTTHRVLDAATVPDIHQLPPGCGTPRLTWDPMTSIATRAYVSSRHWRCLINMTYGSTRAMQAQDVPQGTAGEAVNVRGHTASVYTKNDHLNNDMITLEWSPDRGHIIRLTINAPPAHAITLSEAVAVARSID